MLINDDIAKKKKNFCLNNTRSFCMKTFIFITRFDTVIEDLRGSVLKIAFLFRSF